MIVVGLTGGVASEKSFVAKYLQTAGISVHDSDGVVSALYTSHNKKFVSFLLKNDFKKCVLKNKINKTKIRKDFFNNKEKKITLEQYLHNEVRKSRRIFIKKNKLKEIVFLDIPLLFEGGLENECDLICSTISPLYLRKKRFLKRRGSTKEIFKNIIKNQVKDRERKEKSNYLIDTSKKPKKTYLQVDSIIYDILN